MTEKKITAGTNTMCLSYGDVRYERVDYNPQANPKVVDSIPTEVQSFFPSWPGTLFPLICIIFLSVIFTDWRRQCQVF